MTNATYKKQAGLLLEILPEVAREECFAMHGGTAINLFVRDMPRLSVDIDLTYLPIEDRSITLKNIASALIRIKERIEKRVPGIRIQHKEEIGKLLVSKQGIDIKLEVNLVGRGTFMPAQPLPLCQKAQNAFEAFCVMPIVPVGQLYGGKICAALDRQHPRDLFDVKHMLEDEGLTHDIKTGFIFCLLGSDRPIHEVIRPNLQDQRLAMINQFEGMSEKPFSYEDFEKTRGHLIETIYSNLTDEDKTFLLSIKNVEPDWSIYDFEKFPAVQWKLQNLQKLKQSNPHKHQEQYEALREKLTG